MNSPSEVKCCDECFNNNRNRKYKPCKNPSCICHKESPVSQSVEEELHLILLPAELVPDLEAQITNQIKDLLSTILSTLVEKMEGLKVKEPKDIYDGEDLFPRKYNEGISAAQEVVKKMGV